MGEPKSSVTDNKTIFTVVQFLLPVILGIVFAYGTVKYAIGEYTQKMAEFDRRIEENKERIDESRQMIKEAQQNAPTERELQNFMDATQRQFDGLRQDLRDRRR